MSCHSSMINWLVVYLPLWKIWKSIGMMKFHEIPIIYGKKSCSKPPTWQTLTKDRFLLDPQPIQGTVTKVPFSCGWISHPGTMPGRIWQIWWLRCIQLTVYKQTNIAMENRWNSIDDLYAPITRTSCNKNVTFNSSLSFPRVTCLNFCWLCHSQRYQLRFCPLCFRLDANVSVTPL